MKELLNRSGMKTNKRPGRQDALLSQAVVVVKNTLLDIAPASGRASITVG
jgi:hypothetical protein